jgi:citrate lyase beta subunit
MVALYARMLGITGIDSVLANFSDLEGLEKETRNARMLGFRGKFAIHPSQLEIINRHFTPTDAEIDYAKRVIVAFEEAEARGAASVALDGKMIDIPIVARARALLESIQ